MSPILTPAPIFNQAIYDAIAVHASQCPDIEVCGLVIGDEVVRGQNVAEHSDRQFILDDKSLELLFREQVRAVYHSHCKPDQPTKMVFSGLDQAGRWVLGDIAMSQRWRLPYLMYHTVEQTFDYYNPHGLHPYPLEQTNFDCKSVEFYLKRLHSFGRADCYELLKAWYQGWLDIKLPIIERSPDPCDYKNLGWRRFIDGLESNNFEYLSKFSNLQMHDVLLMRLDETENYHHVAIVCDPGRRRIVHSVKPDSLSQRGIWGGQELIDLTYGIYRHCTLLT